MNKISALVFTVLLPFLALAQHGNLPQSVKWKQIDNSRYKIIFPSNMEVAGQRVANIIELLDKDRVAAIGDERQKVSIILQNQTTVSNGFVTPWNYRSEFFLTPPTYAFNGTVDWLDLLTIHEFRHIQQFDNSNHGITKLAKIFTGQYGYGGMSAVALPNWFFEGDAVSSETVNTNSGRGRMPAFEKQHKALLLAGRDFNYEKARNRSYKDYVPNHYPLGYYMVSYGKQNYGSNFWKDVVADATAYKGILWPFSRSLKKRTGMGSKQFYQATFADLKGKWQKEESALSIRNGEPVQTQANKTFSNYEYPFQVSDTKLVVIKSAFDQVDYITILDQNGGETRKVAIGPNSSVAYSNQNVYWTEIKTHPRWDIIDYSILKKHSLITGKTEKLTIDTKYFAPDVNQQGEIVVIENTEDYLSNVVILNTNGQVQSSFKGKFGESYTFPQWSADGTKIYVIKRKNWMNAIAEIDISSGSETIIKPFNSSFIAELHVYQDQIFFSSSVTGIDNIHVLDLSDKQEYQCTSVKYSARQPSVSADGSKIYFSNYTADGHLLRSLKNDLQNWTKIAHTDALQTLVYPDLEDSEGGNILSDIKNETFETRKYSRMSGLTLHSWTPVLNISTQDPSLTLDVDDKLGTTSLTATAQYDYSDKSMTYQGSFVYRGLFPLLEFRVTDVANRTRPYSTIKGDTAYVIKNSAFGETTIGGQIAIPINFSSGLKFSDLSLSVNYDRVQTNTNAESGILTNEQLNTVGINFYYSNFQRPAIQNVLPRWGQTVSFSRKSVLDQENIEPTLQYTLAAFFPGFKRNHSFNAQYNYRKEALTNPYKFRDTFDHPRGVGTIAGDEIDNLSLNYQLPLIYPDFALSSLAFIKRVRANLFVDKAASVFNRPVDKVDGKVNYTSGGIELMIDAGMFRMLDVTFGFRYSQYQIKGAGGTTSDDAFNFFLRY